VLLAVGMLQSFTPHHMPSSNPASPRYSTSACKLVATASNKESFTLNGQSVAQLIEAAFVPAVMGVSRGDVTELKLFVAAARAGYERNLTVSALGETMRALPVQTAGRPLAPEEDDLRTLWLSLIFMALGDACALIPTNIYQEHHNFVKRLLEAKAAARPLSELSVEEVAGNAATGARTAIQTAVLQQSMRIVYTTVDVLADIDAAGQRADAPRGFIPGQEGDSAAPVPAPD